MSKYEPCRACGMNLWTHSDAALGKCADREAIMDLQARLAAAEAEVERLRRHYDAAAPEHNLLALLDLYHERTEAAKAERDEARDARVAKAAEVHAATLERDAWRRRADEAREAALREAAALAREHGAISVSYRLFELAALAKEGT